MFYLFAIGAMAGYAIQGTLLARFARTIDGLSLAFYRNMSFLVTLLPLLYGASPADIALVWKEWPLLIASGFAGGLNLMCQYKALRFLPVGVSNTLIRASFTIFMLAVGWIFFKEALSGTEIILIIFITVATLSLGFQRADFPHLDNRFFRGLTFTLLSVLPLGFTYIVLTILSRSADPLVSSYFWEVIIGIACILLLVSRWIFFKQKIQKISWRQFGMIALCSFPTLFGTAFYSLAAQAGPIAVLNAIMAGGMVLVALLSWALYGEKLKAGQWGSLLLIIGGIVALKFV